MDQQAKKLLYHINKTFGTLAFCRRWLERPDGGSFAVNGNNARQEKYLGALKVLEYIHVAPYLLAWGWRYGNAAARPG